MADYTTFDYRLQDGVAVVTFSRPEKMNTFTVAMMAELLDLFDRTDADDAVRAVVITGSGRAFCAGADLGAGGTPSSSSPIRGPRTSTSAGCAATAAGAWRCESTAASSR